MTNELPPTNLMDAFAIEDAGRDGPEALEVVNKMRQNHFKMEKLKGREPVRRTGEIQREITRTEEELCRSRKLLDQVGPDEIDSAISLIRGNRPVGPTPRPVHVLEKRLQELERELDDSQVFSSI